MFNLFQKTNYREVGRVVIVATKIIFGFFIVTNFCRALVIGNKNIPTCDERWKELAEDMKNWRERCSNGTQDYGSPCCEAEKEYFQDRISRHRETCFLKGPYPEPFLLAIRSKSEIMAIDLTTHDTTVVVPRLEYTSVLTIDTVDNKMYFDLNKTQLYRTNLDGSSKEIILENVTVYGIALDWIGRRIFWSGIDKIYVMTLDGKERRAVIENVDPYMIAINPITGFLLWLNSASANGPFYQKHLADENKEGSWLKNVPVHPNMTIKYVNRSAGYVITSTGKKIYSFDLGGTKKSHKFISSLTGRDIYGLHIFGNSLYLLEGPSPAGIIEMNVLTTNISRYFSLPDGKYTGIVLVDQSQQPQEPVCGNITCGPYGYCVKKNSSYSCKCEPGFKWNGLACKDTDECFSFPCHSKLNTSCRNYPGSYTCTKCDKGYKLGGVFGDKRCEDIDECAFSSSGCGHLNQECTNTPGSSRCGECVEGFTLNGTKCVAISELKIRLVNQRNNWTGRVEIYHPTLGWGTVCDDDWDINDGHVVCRQLGFIGANVTWDKAHYSKGNGPILLDEVQCTGNESYIWDCPHGGWNNENCFHFEDAGVDCY